MPWVETVQPVRMARVALVAPQDALRAALVTVADSGVVELERPAVEPSGGEAAGRLHRMATGAATPRLSADPPDLAACERDGRADLLAGEAELEEYAAGAVRHGSVAALAGWCPADRLAGLASRLGEVDAALVPMRSPRGIDPPTLLRPGSAVRRSFSPLVRTYGTVPYVDVDPTLLAGVAYVVMFGMMFADAGHGLLLLLAAVLLGLGGRNRPARLRRPRRPARLARPARLPGSRRSDRLARLRPLWPFVAGAGLASTAFGVLFGEFFGPTGVAPVVWLAPLEQPIELLAAGIGLGAALLAAAYAVGVVNRWREGSARLALYAPSGIAGAALFVGLGGLGAGVYLGQTAVAATGAAVAATGFGLAGIGLYAAAGGGAAGAIQAAVQLFDLVLRLGANLVSFARLAAFGLTHTALGALVWSATSGLWHGGWPAALAALAVFALGNLVAFALEALVAGVQALRLEYYELFSRIFEAEGRPFRPWHVPKESS